MLRRDVYSDDMLAWTNFRAGNLDAAKEYIVKALRLGTRDAAMHFHAAMIYRALGNDDEFNRHAATVADINPNFSPLLSSILKSQQTQ